MLTKIRLLLAVVAVVSAAGFAPVISTPCYAIDTPDRCDNRPPPPPPPPPVVAAVRG